MDILRPGEVLRHYAHQPVDRLEDREQEWPESEYAKPRGLWLSVDHPDYMDWPTWCEAEGYDGDWPYVFRVVLAPGARLFRVSDSLELDALTEAFGVPTRYPGRRAIAWPQLAERYQGIIIAPYIGERRLHRATSWYHPWGCASACIWDAAAIDQLVREEAPEAVGP